MNQKIISKLYSKKGEIFSVIMFLSVGFYFFRSIKERKKMLGEDTAYTIAQIKSIEFGPRTAPVYKFTFEFNEKNYESVFSLAGNSLRNAPKELRNKEIGKYYLIRVSTIKPKYNELIFNKIISDSLINCCFGDSWNKIPKGVNKKK